MQHNTLQAITQFLQQLKNSVHQLKPEQLTQAPLWVQQAVQARVVLLINHVLQQDARALERLLAHQGKMVQAQWRQFNICLRITPAGLVALEQHTQAADLNVQVSETNPVHIMRQAAFGQRPNIHISGDAELASSIHWLAENVRWNLHDDLVSIFGAETAQRISQFARIVRDVLFEFVNTVASKAQPTPQSTLPHPQHTDKP